MDRNPGASSATPGFLSSAAGTVRDLREQTDLEREIPFFGSQVEARRFVETCLAKALAELPGIVRYVDFGGGQGVLARAMSDALIAAGRQTSATVIDANANYLAGARARGLQVELANIESCTAADVDLATMRLVNHYCGYEQQALMLKRIEQSLLPGGVFVSQIETGSAAICRLQSQIANALSTEHCAGYHWPTLDEYITLARRAGFDEVCVMGESPPVDASINEALASAWRRFHGRQLQELASRGGIEEMDRVLAQRAEFFRESHALIAAGWGQARPGETQPLALQEYRLRYPIVFCRRPRQLLARSD